MLIPLTGALDWRILGGQAHHLTPPRPGASHHHQDCFVTAEAPDTVDGEAKRDLSIPALRKVGD